MSRSRRWSRWPLCCSAPASSSRGRVAAARALSPADTAQRASSRRRSGLNLRRLRRRARRRFRRFWYGSIKQRRRALWIVGGLLGLGLAWILVTGFVARSQAAQVEAQLARVRLLVSQGQVAQARAAADKIPAMAHRAHRLTTGPAWWIGAHIPYFGRPLSVMREVLAAGDAVGSHAVPELMRVSTLIDPQHLRVSGDTIRTAPLVQARAGLAAAASVIDQADRQVAGLSGTWLSAVDDRRSAFAAQLGVIRGYVDAASRAAQVLPAMLGEHGVQRYFIGLQTEAELRGTGGLPGAFTIATAEHGTVRFQRFESDSALLPPATHQRVPTGLSFGAEYAAAYGASDPTSSYVDSNVSPDFRYAAQIWAAMWQKVSGQRVDGVLAVDPTALGYFLDVVGPAPVPSGQLVTGQNVVALTEKDQYALFPNPAQRKAFEVAVLRSVSHKLTSGSGSAVGLLRAASASAGQHRLLVWSRDPAIERVLIAGDYAGAIPDNDRPFAGLILNNAASGKLDYYLTRSLQYSRTGCGARRDVLVTIRLSNDAPASGLPAYVTTRLDDHAKFAKPGDNRTLLDYYATGGALLESVSVDGQPSTASVLTVEGHAVFRLDLELPRGTTRTIVLHLDEPAGSGAPLIWRQPGVTPLAVQSFNQSC